jgi:hypothetical protein
MPRCLAPGETQTWPIDWNGSAPQPPVISNNAYLHPRCVIGFWN